MGSLSFTAPRKLEPSDTTNGFFCGEELIDDWFARRAANAKARGTSVVYVSHLANAGSEHAPIAGFYTLSAYAVRRDSISAGWFTRNTPVEIPAILLGMLAVDARYAGNGLGAALLRDAVLRARAISDELGAKALIVDPLTDAIASFYRRFGFKKIQGTEKLALRLS